MKNFCKILALLILFTMSNCFAQKIKIACIGNSITAGYLLANPQKESYPSQLQQLLGNNYELGNFGYSGATLLKKGHKPYCNTETFKKALTFNADIAIIHLGLNDTDPRNWPNYKADFKADYSWLIDTLKKNNPKLKIYVCRLSPIFSGHPRFKSGTRAWYWQIQDEIAAVAKANKVDIIDLNAPLNNRPELFADNLHPNTEGAKIIASTVYEKISGNYGGFKIDPIFADHMVLQRNKPIVIYGKANTNDKIELSFNKITQTVLTNSNGQWKASFPAMKFGGPYQMEISCANQKLKIKDVLIGDVWLCSGQSNMAFPLKSSATGKETLKQLKSNSPLRLLKFNPLVETDNVSWDSVALNKINQLDYFSGQWQTVNSASAADFSAVAYYFGEKLLHENGVPIGLIEVALGGSTLESWIDRKSLEDDNLLVDILSSWRKSDFLQEWVRGRADVNLKNSNNLKQRHPYEPAYNYEAGISKLVRFPIKGVIWYQGESNAHNAELYKYEFPILLSSWRKNWGKNMPFYYVQLSAIDRPSWPSFRAMQQELANQIPNVGMVVSSDLGDSLNVHPIFKKEIGNRLALIALKNTYHKNIVAQGPSLLKATKEKDHIILKFANASKLKTARQAPLIGFEIVSKKGLRLPLIGIIKNKEVHLKIPPNFDVAQVLYAWQGFTRANLINEAGLPASTFSINIK